MFHSVSIFVSLLFYYLILIILLFTYYLVLYVLYCFIHILCVFRHVAFCLVCYTFVNSFTNFLDIKSLGYAEQLIFCLFDSSMKKLQHFIWATLVSIYPHSEKTNPSILVFQWMDHSSQASIVINRNSRSHSIWMSRIF